MVAKAGYALHKGYFAPESILLLAFNSAAAAELRERIQTRLSPHGLPHESVTAKTFHAFGLDVIGQATGRRPSIAPWIESGTEMEALMGLVDRLPAAAYVRMSTEHQQYSTNNQFDKIEAYAKHRGLKVVRTFADEGKSGLRIDGRDALKELIRIVESGTAEFKAILVYDVSRWGRFQDADESAYYEYICICAEALHVLRDREFSPGVTKALRKMKPTRQIECAEMMVAGNCSTVHYAKALLAATADDMLVAERRAPRRPTEEQLGLIERETANLRARYRMIEQTYADDVLNLVVAKGYVNKLITNPEIESYLRKWHGELLPEFVALASLSSLED